MLGQVVHVATNEGDGFIRADDGNRYSYAIANWISPQPAVVGDSVDFEMAEDRATMVCAIPANAAPPLSGFVASIGLHRGLLIGLAIFALLLIALNAALVRGMFSSVTVDEHGPIKNYQATGPAKVRDKPTTEGSSVLVQLDPGQAWAGRIYLGPDGQSKWVKIEGSDAYVSIVNLTEVAESNATASLSAKEPIADGTEFLGDWVSTFHPEYYPTETINNIAHIERNGANFLVRLTTDSNRKEWGILGVFAATYQNGILEVTGKNIGGIAYSSSENSIYIKGILFQKSLAQ